MAALEERGTEEGDGSPRAAIPRRRAREPTEERPARWPLMSNSKVVSGYLMTQGTEEGERGVTVVHK